MVISVIDIGTNTVLLLVARVDVQGEITTLSYEQRIPRLGRGVDAHRNLHPESMERVVEVLEEYRKIMAPERPDCVVVAGTSAVRDSGNNAEFGGLIRRRVGLSLEILSGPEEALWTYRGAISGVPGLRNATVVDIGGGSTEITTGDRGTIRSSVSLDIGSVRLTERFFRHDPPLPDELQEAVLFVNRALEQSAQAFTAATVVAVAGTATTLALLDQELPEFSIDAVTNYALSLERIEALYGQLSAMQSTDIRRISGIMEGRSDVITAGALILRQIMRLSGSAVALVSERGLRYGLALREWEKRQRERSQVQ